MARSSSSPRGLLFAAVVCCSLLHFTCAGPLPSNVTSSDVGLQPGSCALGDVVHMTGDEFPGADPCERCACSAGSVQCTRQQCEPRPGCKAVHRPDHCCPTYQCECEQEGRVYGNGEKLVDPRDPCRVCYCQGGEVVCRRIACFVRDDCRPRLVPGRCCPEYDNCPLRGVTTVPGMAPSMSSNVAIEDVGTTPAPAAPEKVKQEITIKEITPVSEIPVLTDVKIKEILPSPSVEVIEYPSSSKSPLIPREATTEKSVASEAAFEPESVSTADNSPSQSSVFTSTTVQQAGDQSTSGFTEIKTTEDTSPSKISLSTDTINSEIYPSNVPIVVSTTSTSPSPLPSTSKAPTEEEDLVPPEHNPAFPPLPDDLSQLSNHEDEISPEPNMDNDHNEHVLRNHEVISSPVLSSGAPTSQEATSTTTTTPATTTTTTFAPNITTTTTTTTTPASTILLSTSEDIKSKFSFSSSRSDSADSADLLATKAYPMLNLRSAIPTEILSIPSSVPEVITGELDEEESSTPAAQEITAWVVSSTTTQLPVRVVEVMSSQSAVLPGAKDLPTSTEAEAPEAEIRTDKVVTENLFDETSSEQTTSYIPKSNIATDVTSLTELSSLPVETSDQNPPRTSDNIEKEKFQSTSEPLTAPTSIKVIPIEGEPITVSKSQSTDQHAPVDKLESTEFLLTSFGSSESATEPVELIKITTTPEKSEAIIVPSTDNKNNILNDLIDLVGDVASMSDHTDDPGSIKSVTRATSISDSEELIPVNAVYKSKNNNFNLNSITEVPLKNKTPTIPNKSKIVEIEDDDESITDSPALNDKSEPTTKRPIIDNVTDDVQKNETSNKDIEIITKSYVPTINRRPTKVVMKKNSSVAVADDTSSGVVQVTASSETATDEAVAASSELTTLSADVTSAEVVDRIERTSPSGGADVQ